MNRESSTRKILRVIGISGMVLFAGCAFNPNRVSSLEDRFVQSDSSFIALRKELSAANKQIAYLESSLDNNVNMLQDKINGNQKESYLRVMVPILNIRTAPTSASTNIIAKAEEGAYLRKIVTSEEDKKWVKVEFLIENYPYRGYVANSEEFVKEEFYDPMTFGRIYNRKLIRYQWETEAAYEMRSNRFKTLGVYIKTDDAQKANRMLGHLSKMFREHKIYVKPLAAFNVNRVTSQCEKNEIEGILSVTIDAVDESASQLDIKLFNKENIILYSTLLPLQAIELNERLGYK